jgi:hypothetical protein
MSETLATPYDEHIAHVRAAVEVLDPALLERPETRLLVDLGAQFGHEVTAQYGTPAAPQWASGSHETDVFMSYHNGGPDGHTSIGAQGAGVPRNVLVIARAVNKAAGWEVYDPLMRATGFYVAWTHDSNQLCGRSLVLASQGEGPGDERLSADEARARYLEYGGTLNIAGKVYDGVMATAFNPATSTQNVGYEAWHSNPGDPEVMRSVLGQELVAAADLLGPVVSHGPLGAIQYSVESLCLQQNDQVLQEALSVNGESLASITAMEQLLARMGGDDRLRSLFIDTMERQVTFFTSHLQYSDQVIREVLGGRGIEDLFPGRSANARIIERDVAALRSGLTTPVMVWHRAQRAVAEQ